MKTKGSPKSKANTVKPVAPDVLKISKSTLGQYKIFARYDLNNNSSWILYTGSPKKVTEGLLAQCTEICGAELLDLLERTEENRLNVPKENNFNFCENSNQAETLQHFMSRQNSKQPSSLASVSLHTNNISREKEKIIGKAFNRTTCVNCSGCKTDSDSSTSGKCVCTQTDLEERQKNTQRNLGVKRKEKEVQRGRKIKDTSKASKSWEDLFIGLHSLENIETNLKENENAVESSCNLSTSPSVSDSPLKCISPPKRSPLQKPFKRYIKVCLQKLDIDEYFARKVADTSPSVDQVTKESDSHVSPSTGTSLTEVLEDEASSKKAEIVVSKVSYPTFNISPEAQHNFKNSTKNVNCRDAGNVSSSLTEVSFCKASCGVKNVLGQHLTKVPLIQTTEGHISVTNDLDSRKTGKLLKCKKLNIARKNYPSKHYAADPSQNTGMKNSIHKRKKAQTKTKQEDQSKDSKLVKKTAQSKKSGQQHTKVKRKKVREVSKALDSDHENSDKSLKQYDATNTNTEEEDFLRSKVGVSFSPIYSSNMPKGYCVISPIKDSSESSHNQERMKKFGNLENLKINVSLSKECGQNDVRQVTSESKLELKALNTENDIPELDRGSEASRNYSSSSMLVNSDSEEVLDYEPDSEPEGNDEETIVSSSCNPDINSEKFDDVSTFETIPVNDKTFFKKKPSDLNSPSELELFQSPKYASKACSPYREEDDVSVNDNYQTKTKSFQKSEETKAEPLLLNDLSLFTEQQELHEFLSSESDESDGHFERTQNTKEGDEQATTMLDSQTEPVSDPSPLVLPVETKSPIIDQLSPVITKGDLCVTFLMTGACRIKGCQMIHDKQIETKQRPSRETLLDILQADLHAGLLNKALELYKVSIQDLSKSDVMECSLAIAQAIFKFGKFGRFREIVYAVIDRRKPDDDEETINFLMKISEPHALFIKDALYSLYSFARNKDLLLSSDSILILLKSMFDQPKLNIKDIINILQYSVIRLKHEPNIQYVTVILKQIKDHKNLARPLANVLVNFSVEDFAKLDLQLCRSLLKILKTYNCFNEANSFEIRVDELHMYLERQKKESETSFVMKIQSWIESCDWDEIVKYFVKDGILQDDIAVIQAVHIALLARKETMVSNLRMFISCVKERCQDQEGKKHLFVLGQMVTGMMLEKHDEKDFLLAYDILLLLHAFDINYYYLQQSAMKAALRGTKYVFPSWAFTTPNQVALTALDICLQVDMPLSAFTVLESCNWARPMEELIGSIAAIETFSRCDLILKVAKRLHSKNELQEGTRVFKEYLDILENDCKDKDDIAAVPADDALDLFNAYLCALINDNDMNNSLDFYDYYERMDANLDMKPSIFRALIISCINNNLLSKAESLYEIAVKIGIYKQQIPKQGCFPNTFTMFSHLTECEMHLVLKDYLRQLFPLLPNCKASFEERFSLHISLQEFVPEDCCGISVLQNISPQLNCAFERLRKALLSETPSLDFQVSPNGILIINPNILYSCFLQSKHGELHSSPKKTCTPPDKQGGHTKSWNPDSNFIPHNVNNIASSQQFGFPGVVSNQGPRPMQAPNGFVGLPRNNEMHDPGLGNFVSPPRQHFQQMPVQNVPMHYSPVNNFPHPVVNNVGFPQQCTSNSVLPSEQQMCNSPLSSQNLNFPHSHYQHKPTSNSVEQPLHLSNWQPSGQPTQMSNQQRSSRATQMCIQQSSIQPTQMCHQQSSSQATQMSNWQSSSLPTQTSNWQPSSQPTQMCNQQSRNQSITFQNFKETRHLNSNMYNKQFSKKKGVYQTGKEVQGNKHLSIREVAQNKVASSKKSVNQGTVKNLRSGDSFITMESKKNSPQMTPRKKRRLNSPAFAPKFQNLPKKSSNVQPTLNPQSIYQVPSNSTAAKCSRKINRICSGEKNQVCASKTMEKLCDSSDLNGVMSYEKDDLSAIKRTVMCGGTAEPLQFSSQSEQKSCNSVQATASTCEGPAFDKIVHFITSKFLQQKLENANVEIHAKHLACAFWKDCVEEYPSLKTSASLGGKVMQRLNQYTGTYIKDIVNDI